MCRKNGGICSFLCVLWVLITMVGNTNGHCDYSSASTSTPNYSEIILSGWVELGWVGLGWVGLGWVGLGWVGLGWVGLGWVGLGCLGLGRVATFLLPINACI